MSHPTSRWRVSRLLRPDASRPVLGAIGVVLVAVGVILVTRPLSSLTALAVYIGACCLLTGVADLADRPAGDLRRGVAGALWCVAGVAVVVWVGRSVDLLVPFVAALLLGSGGLRLVGLAGLIGTRRGITADGVLAGLFGLSEVAFGLAALLWPDATLLVVAVLFGMRSLVLGVSLVWRAAAGRTAARTHRRRRAPVALRWVAGVVLVAVSVGTLALGHAFRQGIPVIDGFYDARASVPPTAGQLLRTEPYAGDLPAGMRAYRMLYTTTDAAGAPALASGVVAVPDVASTTPVPLVAWAHGTKGIARACAPSLGPNAVPVQDIAAMGALTRHGWGVVATDYMGAGTRGAFPYLVGEGEGRSVLDSIRAAHQVEGLGLADAAVVWGHSQGGHAALWAGQIAPQYAPELQIRGIAAISPASDPPALAAGVAAHPGAVGASLGISFVVTAYARSYPDVDLDAIVVPSGRPFVKEAAARCTADLETVVTVLTGMALAQDPIVRVDPTQGAFGRRLADNVPLGPWAAPLLIGQGSADEVVDPAIQAAYVARLCGAVRPLQFTSYPGQTHLGVLKAGSPLPADLEAWTQDRFAGLPARTTC